MRGVLQVLGKRAGAFAAADERFALALADQIGRALDYTSLRGDDDRRGVPLRSRFNHVIGASPAMRAVYDLVARAATTCHARGKGFSYGPQPYIYCSGVAPQPGEQEAEWARVAASPCACNDDGAIAEQRRQCSMVP